MKDNTKNELLPYVKFLFELKTPPLEHCYQYGYQAAQNGSDESENPFIDHHCREEKEYWLQGWWDSFYGIKPIFSIVTGLNTKSSNNTSQPDFHILNASNNGDFNLDKDSKLTSIAKLATTIAGVFFTYQIIDMVV